jgi:hypothetical protein
MKKKVVYEDVPFGKFERIFDDLPKPEDLVLRETNVRVTLNLSQTSVSYFKGLGKKSHVPYQKLIRRFLDEVSHR